MSTTGFNGHPLADTEPASWDHSSLLKRVQSLRCAILERCAIVGKWPAGDFLRTVGPGALLDGRFETDLIAAIVSLASKFIDPTVEPEFNWLGVLTVPTLADRIKDIEGAAFRSRLVQWLPQDDRREAAFLDACERIVNLMHVVRPTLAATDSLYMSSYASDVDRSTAHDYVADLPGRSVGSDSYDNGYWTGGLYGLGQYVYKLGMYNVRAESSSGASFRAYCEHYDSTHNVQEYWEYHAYGRTWEENITAPDCAGTLHLFVIAGGYDHFDACGTGLSEGMNHLVDITSIRPGFPDPDQYDYGERVGFHADALALYDIAPALSFFVKQSGDLY